MKSTASSKQISTKRVKSRRTTKKKSEQTLRTPSNNSPVKKQTLKLLAKLSFGGGIIFFIIFFNMMIMRIFPVQKPKTLGSATKKVAVEINIPSVGIDLPIFPAQFINGTFQTTTKGASYLTSSILPGGEGNSIIYAHNWWNLFGSLTKVKKGEKITIIFSDKTTQTFTITNTETVSAYTASILQPTTNRQLTLFTCTNFLDADRFVVIAN